MLHEMKLNNKPFKSIKARSKTIEMRLYDEKRKLVNVRDNINFINRSTGEELLTQVLAIHKFKNFEELYNAFNKSILGYKENEIANPKDMSQYYSDEDIKKYGMIGIEIKVI